VDNGNERNGYAWEQPPKMAVLDFLAASVPFRVGEHRSYSEERAAAPESTELIQV